MTNPLFPALVHCLIIDEDCCTSGKIEICLTELPCIALLGTVRDADGTRAILSQNDHLDVIFLVVKNCNSIAFEIAGTLRDQVKCIVFIGNDNESALKAFKAGGDYFLLSSLCQSEFNNSVGKLLKKQLTN